MLAIVVFSMALCAGDTGERGIMHVAMLADTCGIAHLSTFQRKIHNSYLSQMLDPNIMHITFNACLSFVVI